MRYHIVVVGALAGAAGCSNPASLDTRRVVGIIDPGVQVATIEAPETVRLGARFTATVNSFGSSTCTSPDGVRLTRGPAEARVTPYDRVPADDNIVCTADIAPRPHPVELSFTEPGRATIVAQGYIIDQTSGARLLGEVKKTIVVVRAQP